MSYWFGLSLLWVPIALRLWIFLLLGRRNLYRRFPWFSLYTLYMVISGLLKGVFLSDWHVYFYVYWIAEPGEILLSILAVHESFMKVFGDFYRLLWFRFLFPAAIATALLYSGWKAYAHPPQQVSAVGSAIVSMAIAAQYSILGIAILFFLLVRFIHVRWRLYEFRFVLGFGVASLIYAFAAVFRSENGTHFAFLSEYLPGMGYVLAVFIWLNAMLAMEPKNGDNIGGMRESQLLQDLHLHLRTIKRFLGRD
jgi:hypothetical protein